MDICVAQMLQRSFMERYTHIYIYTAALDGETVPSYNVNLFIRKILGYIKILQAWTQVNKCRRSILLRRHTHQQVVTHSKRCCLVQTCPFCLICTHVRGREAEENLFQNLLTPHTPLVTCTNSIAANSPQYAGMHSPIWTSHVCTPTWSESTNKI